MMSLETGRSILFYKTRIAEEVEIGTEKTEE